jgi:hypothetical protein
METHFVFRENPLTAQHTCTFPYAALKAFIPTSVTPSDTHFSTGFE